MRLEVALEQVGRRACVLGRRAALACRERGREPLVVRLDRHADDAAKSLDERVGLESLCTALAAQRHRHPDDDAIGLVLEDEVAHLRQSVLAGRALDHAQRPRDRSGRIRDGDAGARGAVVERQHPHSAATMRRSASASASGSFSGSFPPARAIVGRPPPPPPTIAAASRSTSDALTFSATAASKFATRCTLPSSFDPRTTAAGACFCL